MYVLHGRLESAGQPTFADARRLAGEIAEVVETCPADPTLGEQLDALDTGVVQSKCLFDADTVRDLAHRIGGIHGAVLALGDHAMEDLDALLAALDDPDMDLDGVAGTEIRMILAHLFQIDPFNNCAHNVFLCGLSIFGSRAVAAAEPVPVIGVVSFLYSITYIILRAADQG